MENENATMEMKVCAKDKEGGVEMPVTMSENAKKHFMAIMNLEKTDELSDIKGSNLKNHGVNYTIAQCIEADQEMTDSWAEVIQSLK